VGFGIREGKLPKSGAIARESRLLLEGRSHGLGGYIDGDIHFQHLRQLSHWSELQGPWDRDYFIMLSGGPKEQWCNRMHVKLLSGDL
jgi:hypothetical protein